MKRFLLYSLLACLCGTMQSCLFSEDDVFEQSSAERENASVAELKELLKNAGNGWKMEYRYGEEGNWGVANIFMRFEDDAVIMASDYSTDSYAVGEECKSLYTVQSYHGTELSFDSFNEVLHSFCERISYFDAGLMGDYEFIVRSSSEDEIQLSGKKFGVDMVMTRLAEDVDWAAYLQKSAKIADDSDLPAYNVMVGGQKVARLDRTYIERSFSVTEKTETETVTTYYPFMCTEDGIRLLEPLTLGGATMQNFTWDGNAKTFTCTDEGVNASLVYERPEGYDKYLGKYEITGAYNLETIELEPYKDGRVYVANYGFRFSSGMSVTFKVLLNYDLDTDEIYIDGTNPAGTDSNGNTVLLYLGFEVSPGSGSYSYYTTNDFEMRGVTTVDDQSRITVSFGIPSGFAQATSLLFMSDGIWDVWTDPVLTKID